MPTLTVATFAFVIFMMRWCDGWILQIDAKLSAKIPSGDGDGAPYDENLDCGFGVHFGKPPLFTTPDRSETVLLYLQYLRDLRFNYKNGHEKAPGVKLGGSREWDLRGQKLFGYSLLESTTLFQLVAHAFHRIH